MTVIKIEGSEEMRHTLKGSMKLLEEYNISWQNVVMSRCPRCNCIFISNTDRKYCSKDCQYDRKAGVSR